MVGGNDYENHQYNRVTQAQRQPGSTFKAFVYTTAIAAGFSPYRSYTDAPYIVDGYQPENYGDKYSGGQVSMRQAGFFFKCGGGTNFGYCGLEPYY